MLKLVKLLLVPHLAWSPWSCACLVVGQRNTVNTVSVYWPVCPSAFDTVCELYFTIHLFSRWIDLKANVTRCSDANWFWFRLFLLLWYYYWKFGKVTVVRLDKGIPSQQRNLCNIHRQVHVYINITKVHYKIINLYKCIYIWTAEDFCQSFHEPHPLSPSKKWPRQRV